MSENSSDEESVTVWIPYKDRPDWKDVLPVPQDDGPNPVVQIAYTEKFKDVYDYFRAVMLTGEKTDRALELTKDAADLNPANYTVWHYRRLVLHELGKDLKDELGYITGLIEEHPKNYQVWHHRKVIVELSNGDPHLELDFISSILTNDAKNYHAWQYRQWVLWTCGELWDQELEYVDSLLLDDPRNNSAWNQRYFVVFSTTGFTDVIVEFEMKYAQNFIKKAPNNESPWSYLKGVLRHRGLSGWRGLSDFCERLYADSCRSPHLLACMVDICEDQLNLGSDRSCDALQRAVKLCSQLAEEFDTIRLEYWRYVSRSLHTKYSKETDDNIEQ